MATQEDLEEEVRDLKEEVKRLEGDVDDAECEADDLRGERRELLKRIGALEEMQDAAADAVKWFQNINRNHCRAVSEEEVIENLAHALNRV